MVLVRDLGQKSNSKFNHSLCGRLMLYTPSFEAVQFSHLQNQQRTPPSTDTSIFPPHRVVILLGAEYHISYHNRN